MSRGRGPAGVGAAVAWWGWVLIGLGVWLIVAVVGALVLARLVRANRPTTVDLVRTRDELEVPEQRDPEHDRAQESTERRWD